MSTEDIFVLVIICLLALFMPMEKSERYNCNKCDYDRYQLLKKKRSLTNREKRKRYKIRATTVKNDSRSYWPEWPYSENKIGLGVDNDIIVVPFPRAVRF